ncbi:MAG: response regulator [Nitrospiraceae bacterium]|nr:response regulator [Nitrospiraceae bacterium]
MTGNNNRSKILIVEDESITAMSMADLLELWGYEVCEPAPSGEDALKAAAAETPSLAILDVKLKGDMSGLELAARLKDGFGIPVIFISGYADNAIMKQAEEAGASGYLLKPFDLGQLKNMIEHVLGGPKG